MKNLLQRMNHIIVVGVGGTGSFLLPPLVRYINSRTDINEKIELIFVDGDKYDEGNVSRQEFAHSRIGQNKASVQAEMFRLKYRDLNIVDVPEYLGETNIKDVIPENSVVFCCVDNHFCRMLISKHCQTLNNVLLISGGNEEYDGNVQSFHREDGENKNNPIEVRHPEIATANDGDRSEMSCEQLATLPSGGQVIFANMASAGIMCELFFAYECLTPEIEKVDDIFFDIRLAKRVRVKDGRYE